MTIGWFKSSLAMATAARVDDEEDMHKLRSHYGISLCSAAATSSSSSSSSAQHPQLHMTEKGRWGIKRQTSSNETFEHALHPVCYCHIRLA
eukprot:16211-Heterococcus_DN1.PRE.1